jgi:hypothetical protein
MDKQIWQLNTHSNGVKKEKARNLLILIRIRASIALVRLSENRMKEYIKEGSAAV